MKRGDVVSCDELHSIPKTMLTDYISNLSHGKMEAVNAALRFALAVE